MVCPQLRGYHSDLWHSCRAANLFFFALSQTDFTEGLTNSRGSQCILLGHSASLAFDITSILHHLFDLVPPEDQQGDTATGDSDKGDDEDKDGTGSDSSGKGSVRKRGKRGA